MGLQLISCSQKLRIDIRPEKPNFTAQGHPMEPDKALFIQFEPGGNVPEHARALVETLPGFRQGIGRDEDPYTTRLGWFDTVEAQARYGWSDADREYVEEKVLRVGDPNVLVLEQLRVPAPYANWAKHRTVKGKRTIEHVLADIQSVYDTAGFDVGGAVAHERQNGNDPRVIEFLSGLDVPEASEESDELVAA